LHQSVQEHSIVHDYYFYLKLDISARACAHACAQMRAAHKCAQKHPPKMEHCDSIVQNMRWNQ
jgi:hypothetical protein